MHLRIVKYKNQKKILYAEISDHQQSWGYEDGPWKGPRPLLLVAADFLQRAKEC